MPSCHNLFMCEWQFYCSVIAFTVRICIMFHKQRLIHFKHNHIVRFCLAFAFPANERIDNSQNEIVAFFPLCKSQRWDLNVDVSKVTNEFVFFFFFSATSLSLIRLTGTHGIMNTRQWHLQMFSRCCFTRERECVLLRLMLLILILWIYFINFGK